MELNEDGLNCDSKLSVCQFVCVTESQCENVTVSAVCLSVGQFDRRSVCLCDNVAVSFVSLSVCFQFVWL